MPQLLSQSAEASTTPLFQWPGSLAIKEKECQRRVSVSVVKGEHNLTAQANRLQAIANRCGSSLVVCPLSLAFLCKQLEGKATKVPYAFILSDSAGKDIAVALLHQYTFKGLPTGIYTPLDTSGQYSLIAAPEDMREVMLSLSKHLFGKRAAQFVLLCTADDNLLQSRFEDVRNSLNNLNHGTHLRVHLSTLQLKSTFAETLTTLGADTRRNLTRYRNRAITEFGVCLSSNLSLTASEFCTFSDACSYPTSTELNLWRYENYGKASTNFILALKAQDGKILSVVGGRRHGTLTRIDWQRNVTGLKGGSIVNAMRSFLIEHEISLGMQRIRFERGTPHSSQNYFTPELVRNICLTRKLMKPWFVENVLLRLMPPKGILKESLDPALLEWNY